MGNNITNFCGCSNNVASSNEAKLSKEGNDKLLTESNLNNDNDKTSDFQSINKKQPSNPIHTDDYLNKVKQIQKHYRAYKQQHLEPTHLLNNYGTSQSNAMLRTISFTYTGDKDLSGNKHGFGIQKWSDDSKYIGLFEHNQAVGYGIFFHPDGDIYQGQFKADRANGYGEYIHKNGAVYYGMWNNDSQYDVGYEQWNDNSTYSGVYRNGKKDGIGTYIWQDKTMYQGEWVENTIEGYGSYYFTDHKSYVGSWKANKMHGYGEFSWVDGRRYCGFYCDDKKHGFGIHYWPNGEKYYVGFWKQGKQHGNGKYIKGNDMKYGLWSQGKKEKWYQDEEEFVNGLNAEEVKYKNFLVKTVNDIKQFMSEAVSK